MNHSYYHNLLVSTVTLPSVYFLLAYYAPVLSLLLIIICHKTSRVSLIKQNSLPRKRPVPSKTKLFITSRKRATLDEFTWCNHFYLFIVWNSNVTMLLLPPAPSQLIPPLNCHSARDDHTHSSSSLSVLCPPKLNATMVSANVLPSFSRS